MGRWRSLRVSFAAMASPCHIEAHGRNERHLHAAITASIAEVHRIERKYSRYRNDSVVARLHENQGQWHKVDAETQALLNLADTLWQESDGRFDITSGVLRLAWDFRAAEPRPPSQARLDALRERVGWARVERRPGMVRLAPGTEIDFGGIGKEYATDRAAAVLVEHGVRHAIVNLGGDIFALGPPGLPERAGEPWWIEIENPRAVSKGTAIARVPLMSGAITTSGDYERYFEFEGKRYCHVLNPKTGWPVTHWQSVTVRAPSTSSAGAISTIAMLMENAALEWLRRQSDIDYLLVRHDGAIVASSGFGRPR